MKNRRSPGGSTRGLLACVGDPSRYRVLLELVGGELCVTELAERVGLSQSCTTRHLQALGRVGAVARRRDGKRVLFRIADEPRLDELMTWVLRGSEPRKKTRRRAAVGSDPSPEPRESTGAPAAVSETTPSREPCKSTRSSDMEDYLL